MLSAESLFMKGRHSALLPPTTLEADTGGLLLVSGDDQSTRTALALVLAGRMRPTAGNLAWGHNARLEHLRRHAALIDSPEVNEPERHFRVRDLVAEDLALIPRRNRPRGKAADWLSDEGLSDLSPRWVEELAPDIRLDLLTRLALADVDVELLVFDSPDRHGADPEAWLPVLTGSVSSPTRLVTAVAVVAQIPPDWTGPTAAAGASADTNAASSTTTAEEVSA
ncbi:ABC transporter ATP-binding protein [Arthrobacter sp. zg-Y895]|uniref:ABC transporter ATP-binding protein n=1 Tax=Arthrobacter sp. zg-Y895 TaxID=2886933 RepID=UPI001D15E191|nr:ABC transporter ATP-binding protein [Arthrobacter sp. zg-Y895]MCC3302649.1 ABC transporter ATP-binding protein [Arthrobacter sp. zg-Y895]